MDGMIRRPCLIANVDDPAKETMVHSFLERVIEVILVGVGRKGKVRAVWVWVWQSGKGVATLHTYIPTYD